jgi:hypothetical protein
VLFSQMEKVIPHCTTVEGNRRGTASKLISQTEKVTTWWAIWIMEEQEILLITS